MGYLNVATDNSGKPLELCWCESKRLNEGETARRVDLAEFELDGYVEVHTRRVCVMEGPKPFTRLEYGE